MVLCSIIVYFKVLCSIIVYFKVLCSIVLVFTGVVIANKVDLDQRRIISPKMGSDFAASNGLKHFECSAVSFGTLLSHTCMFHLSPRDVYPDIHVTEKLLTSVLNHIGYKENQQQIRWYKDRAQFIILSRIKDEETKDRTPNCNVLV